MPDAQWPTSPRDPQPGDRPPVRCTLGDLIDQHMMVVQELSAVKARFRESERAICQVPEVGLGVVHGGLIFTAGLGERLAIILPNDPSEHAGLPSARDILVPKGLLGDKEDRR